MVKPAQAHPKPTRKLRAPSKHGQTHPSPVKAWSKPPQSHPTFKTRSNPPHPPAPLLNRSNPPRVLSKHCQTHPSPFQAWSNSAKPTPNPRRTHPKPTRYSQSLQNMVKPTPNPRAQPCRWGRRPSPKSSSSLGAWQLKIRACNTLKYLCCSKPKPAKKTFILQCLASDSAQPQKTLRPRWSTPQSLKRDSYPQKTPTKTCSSTGGPAALPGRSPSYGEVRRPRFQGRKTQAILASPGRASTVAVLPHCSIQRQACSCFGQAPACSARRCPKLLEKGQARSGCLRPQAQIQGPKKRAVSRPQKWGREMDPAPAIQFGIRLGG